MSGVSFWEFLFICMIGLVVLGPERLPKVANQIGSWVGQARRMTRTMRRQLEEEIDLDLDLEKELGMKSLDHPIPHDDDSYSPLHEQPENSIAAGSIAEENEQPVEAKVVEATTENLAEESREQEQDKNQNQNTNDEQRKQA